MTGALAALAVLALIRAVRRRAKHARADIPAVQNRRRYRGASFVLVAAIVFGWLALPALVAAPGAAAGAWPWSDCKDIPSLESPGQTSTDFFDSDSQTAEGDGTDYGTYGWAGLSYKTYDLGCGPAFVRAPTTVADTTFGNAGLTTAKWFTGLAVWLDRQNTVNSDGTSPASTVLGRLDQVVSAGSKALRTAFYDPWIGVAGTVVAILMLTYALKASAASAMRQSVVAGVAVFLAALVIGTPLTTMHEVNREFNATTGQVQAAALRQVGVDPKTGPRQAVIKQIIERQWLAGYFADPDSPFARRYAGTLRDSLAYTWHEQVLMNRFSAALSHGDPANHLHDAAVTAALPVINKKNREYTAVANAAKAAGGYLKFIGKDGGRTSAGWTAALEALCVDMLWIAASLLRFVGMVIVELAVLFGPVWAPPAMVSERVLGSMVRFVGAALAWAVVAAAAVAVDLVVITGVFNTDLPAGWKVFAVVLISAVLWMLLRPFKRLAQTVAMRTDPRQKVRRAIMRGGPGRRRRYYRGDEPDDGGETTGPPRRRGGDGGSDPAGASGRRPVAQEGRNMPEPRPLAVLQLPPAPTAPVLPPGPSSPPALPRTGDRRQLPPGAAAPAAVAPAPDRRLLPPAAPAAVAPAPDRQLLPPAAPRLALTAAASQKPLVATPTPPPPAPSAPVQSTGSPALLAADTGAPAGAAGDLPRRGQVVTVDAAGRVVDVLDDVYVPAAPRPADSYLDHELTVYDVYTPATDPWWTDDGDHHGAGLVGAGDRSR